MNSYFNTGNNFDISCGKIPFMCILLILRKLAKGGEELHFLKHALNIEDTM